MIKQMMKLAGARNEKEFLKMFPTEASFLKKHGGDLLYMYGGSYQEGGMTPQDQQAMMMMQQQQAAQQQAGPQQGGGGQPSQDQMMQQIVQFIVQALQQGAAPDDIMKQLVEQGIPGEQASKIVQAVIQKIQQEQVAQQEQGAGMGQQMSPDQMQQEQMMAQQGQQMGMAYGGVAGTPEEEGLENQPVMRNGGDPGDFFLKRKPEIPYPIMSYDVNGNLVPEYTANIGPYSPEFYESFVPQYKQTYGIPNDRRGDTYDEMYSNLQKQGYSPSVSARVMEYLIKNYTTEGNLLPYQPTIKRSGKLTPEQKAAIEAEEAATKKKQEEMLKHLVPGVDIYRKGGSMPCYKCGGKYKNGGSYSGTYSAGVYYANGGPYIPDYSGVMMNSQFGQDGAGDLVPPGTPSSKSLFKHGGLHTSKYKKGGEYEMTQDEIQDLINKGYKIQYV